MHCTGVETPVSGAIAPDSTPVTSSTTAQVACVNASVCPGSRAGVACASQCPASTCSSWTVCLSWWGSCMPGACWRCLAKGQGTVCYGLTPWPVALLPSAVTLFFLLLVLCGCCKPDCLCTGHAPAANEGRIWRPALAVGHAQLRGVGRGPGNSCSVQRPSCCR